MYVTTGHLATAEASRYLQQLCKHFGHKVAVRFDEREGEAALGTGPALLTADAQGLTVRLEAASGKDLIQARYVIESHLVTFAHREDFTGMTWAIDQRPGGTAGA